jgi:hypothetical protein
MVNVQLGRWSPSSWCENNPRRTINDHESVEKAPTRDVLNFNRGILFRSIELEPWVI